MRRGKIPSEWTRRLAAGGVLLAAVAFAPPDGARVQSQSPPPAQVQRPGRVQRPAAIQRRPALTAPQTRLQVQQRSGDNPVWGGSWDINVPFLLTFMWSTKEAGVTSARWQVTDKQVTATGEAPHIYLEAGLPSVPAPGKIDIFSVDFKKFAPAKPPQTGPGIAYYVQVVLLNAQNEQVAFSPAVRILYHGSGPVTQFEEEMAAPTDTLSQGLLTQAYNALKGRFRLQAARGPITSSASVPALQLFDSPDGVVSMELAKSPTRVYVSVPRLDALNHLAGYQWFEYVSDRQYGWVLKPDRDQDPPPDKLPPVLVDTGAYASYTNYGFYEVSGRGKDPSHWSPILITDDAAYIGQVHRNMQFSGSQKMAFDALAVVRNAVKQQDLTDRAMKPWQSVRLNGIIADAGFPGGDLGVDHATGYHDGTETPTGPLGEETNPDEFPGMDWDLTVNPDPAYAYLGSIPRASLKVEIEHFALGLGDRGSHNYRAYFPRDGEWLQTIGRWVTDNGHPEPEEDVVNGFYTEIHPPEMMVSSRYVDRATTEAKVIVTGAWRGDPLTFVINPPARPSATSQLKWKILRIDGSEGYDRKDKADLQLVTTGGAAPCYLRGTITKTGTTARPMRYNTGLVGLDGTRGMLCIVRCWWEDPSGSLTGRLMSGAEVARGAYLFYRDASSANVPWQIVNVDATGRFTLPRLLVNATYVLRPAGSGWDFAGAPVQWTAQSASATRNFQATRTPTPRSIDIRPVAAMAGRRPEAADRNRIGAAMAGVSTSSTLQTLRGLLVTLEEPNHDFGVYQNGMGYPQEGTVHLQIRGMLDWNGKPVPTLQEATTTESGGAIQIQGQAGAGVPGVKVRARFLLGNSANGYRAAGEAIGQTNSDGIVIFRFGAGSHVEDGLIQYEVVENPFNPWFTPSFRGSTWHFFPAAQRGDGAMAGAPGYRIELRQFLPSDRADRAFLAEARDRRAFAAAGLKQGLKQRRPTPALLQQLKKSIGMDEK